MNEPLISVITPSYNQAEFIESTIKSVLNQTYKNIQYIIVDGGSQDGSMEIVHKYNDRIDIIISEKDTGQSNAINKGFRLARGELIGWINSDDLLYPKCIEKIVDLYVNKPDGSIFYCKFLDKINAEDYLLESIEVNIPDKNHLLNVDYILNQPGSFYKSDFIREIGYIDENIHYCMDLDLWLRLLDHGNIYYVDQTAYSAFRIWPGTKTSTGGRLFLQDIRNVLLKNSANRLSKSILRTYLYSLKSYVLSKFPN